MKTRFVFVVLVPPNTSWLATTQSFLRWEKPFVCPTRPSRRNISRCSSMYEIAQSRWWVRLVWRTVGGWANSTSNWRPPHFSNEIHMYYGVLEWYLVFVEVKIRARSTQLHNKSSIPKTFDHRLRALGLFYNHVIEFFPQKQWSPRYQVTK